MSVTFWKYKNTWVVFLNVGFVRILSVEKISSYSLNVVFSNTKIVLPFCIYLHKKINTLHLMNYTYKSLITFNLTGPDWTDRSLRESNFTWEIVKLYGIIIIIIIIIISSSSSSSSSTVLPWEPG
jgi:hypothetical protein